MFAPHASEAPQVGRAADEALRAAEERLRLISAGANLGMWDWNPDTDEIWCNEIVFTMLGYPTGQRASSGRTLRELICPDDVARMRGAVIEHFRDRTPEYRVELRMRCRDGTWRWVLHRGRTVARDDTGRVTRVVGVQADFTYQRELQMQLASAQRLEAIGQLAAGIAHEINTPVQYVNDSVYFIREAVQELLEHVGRLRATSDVAPEAEILELEQELPAALDRAAEGLARVAEIVVSMKEFSHPDHDHMVPVDLNRAIQKTLIVARSEFKYVADLETDFGALPAVTCYGSQINQVVLNLVVNAAHAIADAVAGGSRRGLIRIRTFVDGTEAVIAVSDDGGGIPEGIRHRIFEPFFTTKEVGRGTGQGLSIARKAVVQGHGGSLTFETEVGHGTTFFVRLPIEGRHEPARAMVA